MSKGVRITPEAAEDVRQAVGHFEGLRPGLGDDFSDEVLRLLDLIRDMPEMFGEVEPGIRAVTVRRFRYVIYYRVHESESEILAVLHGRRSDEARQGRG